MHTHQWAREQSLSSIWTMCVRVWDRELNLGLCTCKAKCLIIKPYTQPFQFVCSWVSPQVHYTAKHLLNIRQIRYACKHLYLIWTISKCALSGQFACYYSKKFPIHILNVKAWDIVHGDHWSQLYSGMQNQDVTVACMYAKTVHQPVLMNIHHMLTGKTLSNSQHSHTSMQGMGRNVCIWPLTVKQIGHPPASNALLSPMCRHHARVQKLGEFWRASSKWVRIRKRQNLQQILVTDGASSICCFI